MILLLQCLTCLVPEQDNSSLTGLVSGSKMWYPVSQLVVIVLHCRLTGLVSHGPEAIAFYCGLGIIFDVTLKFLTLICFIQTFLYDLCVTLEQYTIEVSFCRILCTLSSNNRPLTPQNNLHRNTQKVVELAKNHLIKILMVFWIWLQYRIGSVREFLAHS